MLNFGSPYSHSSMESSSSILNYKFNFLTSEIWALNNSSIYFFELFKIAKLTLKFAIFLSGKSLFDILSKIDCNSFKFSVNESTIPYIIFN